MLTQSFSSQTVMQKNKHVQALLASPQNVCVQQAIFLSELLFLWLASCLVSSVVQLLTQLSRDVFIADRLLAVCLWSSLFLHRVLLHAQQLRRRGGCLTQWSPCEHRKQTVVTLLRGYWPFLRLCSVPHFLPVCSSVINCSVDQSRRPPENRMVASKPCALQWFQRSTDD